MSTRGHIDFNSDKDEWLVTTTVRHTDDMRLVAGARALPARIERAAEWTLPATIESVRQVSATLGKVTWSVKAKKKKKALLARRKSLIKHMTGGEERVLDTGQTLAGFQSTGVDWLTKVGSGILADEMGLGKTVEVVVALETLATNYVTPGFNAFEALILSPTSVLGVWEEHIEEWTSIKPFVYHGAGRAKVLQAYHSWPGHKALISSHGLITKHSYQMHYGSNPKVGEPGEFNHYFNVVVADEADQIGLNPNNKTVRAMTAIARGSDVVWPVTGTPINDSPKDGWVLMSYANPDILGSYDRFAKRYCIERDSGFGEPKNLGLHPDMEDEYHWVVKPWMLRRLKVDHLPDLPVMEPQIIKLPMVPAQSRAYSKIVNDTISSYENPDGSRSLVVAMGPLSKNRFLEYGASALPIVEVSEVKGLSHKASNKFNYILEVAKAREGDPFVVYTWSSREAQMYVEGLQEHGIHATSITGEISDHKIRTALVKTFQAGETPVLVITNAASTGVTLTAADLIILTRPSWRPKDLQQVMDRINRWGQKRHPQAQIMVSDGTLDQVRLASLAGKVDIQDELIISKTALAKLLRGEQKDLDNARQF